MFCDADNENENRPGGHEGKGGYNDKAEQEHKRHDQGRNRSA